METVRTNSAGLTLGFTSKDGVDYRFIIPNIKREIFSANREENFLLSAAALLLMYSKRDINAGKFSFNHIIERDYSFTDGGLDPVPECPDAHRLIRSKRKDAVYCRIPFPDSLIPTLQSIQIALNEAALEVYKRDDLTPEEKKAQAKQRSTAVLLSAIENTGNTGKEYAAAIRTTKKDPWRKADVDSLKGTPPDAVGFALIIVGYIDALWIDTRPLEQKRITVAASYSVAQTLNRLQTRGAVVLTGDHDKLIEQSTGQALARVTATDAAVLKRLSRGADELSTMNGHNIIRWIRAAGHYQYTMMPDNPEAARVIEIEHGWEGLYQMATGCSQSVAQRNAPAIKDLILLLKSAVFEIPHVSSGLLDYTYFEPGPGKPSILRITINEVLMPGFVNKLQKGSKARWLVPMPERLPFSLNLVAGQMKAPCICLLNGIFLFATDRAIDLAKTGSFEMTRHDWQCLTDTAQVVKKTKQAIEKQWIVETPQQLAFDSVLIKVDEDRYQFSPLYRNENAFIIGSGNKRVRGRSAGQAAAAQRVKKDSRKN